MITKDDIIPMLISFTALPISSWLFGYDELFTRNPISGSIWVISIILSITTYYTSPNRLTESTDTLTESTNIDFYKPPAAEIGNEYEKNLTAEDRLDKEIRNAYGQ